MCSNYSLHTHNCARPLHEHIIERAPTMCRHRGSGHSAVDSGQLVGSEGATAVGRARGWQRLGHRIESV